MPALAGQVAHRAAEERARGGGRDPQHRRHREQLPGGLAVDLEVVLAADHVIPGARRVRDIGIDLRRAAEDEVVPLTASSVTVGDPSAA